LLQIKIFCEGQKMHEKYDKPLFVLKPDLMNSLVPEFFFSSFRAAVLTGLVYAVFFFFGLFEKLDMAEYQKIIYPIVVVLVLSLPQLLYRGFILMMTKYSFYNTHIVYDFSFIIIRKFSVPYHQITNVSLNITIWDRLTKSGNIVIHTADDTTPDLHLNYVSNPEVVERRIYELVKLHLVTKNHTR